MVSLVIDQQEKEGENEGAQSNVPAVVVALGGPNTTVYNLKYGTK